MKEYKMFPITSICIADVIQAIESNYCGDDELEKIMLIKKAKKLKEIDMLWLAKKLGDDFCNTSFWGSLADRFKQIVDEEK